MTAPTAAAKARPRRDGRSPFAIGKLLDRGLVEVGAAATLPVAGLGNASASCWSLTLEQLAPRIIEFGLASQDTLDRAQSLLADARFGDLGHGTLPPGGRRPSP